MKKPVIVIGLGEIGGVFARGFLRSGHPVFPVLREDNLQHKAREIDDPQLILLTVAEKDLHAALAALPNQWKPNLCLVQNELLPRDWRKYALDPTVISVWFEKKKGQDTKVLLPSPVYGTHANMIRDALGSLDIPATELQSIEDLEYQLVVKNVYILTTNIAGIVTEGDVKDLKDHHGELAQTLASEIQDIQQWLCGRTFDSQALWWDFIRAVDADPQHKCKGRTAPDRLKRALTFADEAGLDVPKMREINATLSG